MSFTSLNNKIADISNNVSVELYDMSLNITNQYNFANSNLQSHRLKSIIKMKKKSSLIQIDQNRT